MPRAGLHPDAVVAAAAELADRDGLDALTISALAARLGVRPPSLYVHVQGLDDLRRRLAALAGHEFADVLQRSVAGRSGGDALRALAADYRAWAKAHPGRYAALQRAADQDERAARRVIESVLSAFRGYGFTEAAAIHHTRAVRAALHGFVVLETSGGFGMPFDIDESFARLVAILERGLAEAGAD